MWRPVVAAPAPARRCRMQDDGRSVAATPPAVVPLVPRRGFPKFMAVRCRTLGHGWVAGPGTEVEEPFFDRPEVL